MQCGRGIGTFTAVILTTHSNLLIPAAFAENNQGQIVYQTIGEEGGASTVFKQDAPPLADPKGDLTTDTVIVTPAAYSDAGQEQQGISVPPSTAKFAQICGGNSGLSPADAKSLVQHIALLRGDDAALDLSLVQQESNFSHDQVSDKGAIGLTQLMPETASRLGVNPCLPEENVRGGLAYLAELRSQFGNPVYALAAYNAGPDRVIQYHGVPPFRETLNYVAAILTNYYGAGQDKSANPGFSGQSDPHRRTATNAKHREKPSQAVTGSEWHSGFVMNLD